MTLRKVSHMALRTSTWHVPPKRHVGPRTETEMMAKHGRNPSRLNARVTVQKWHTGVLNVPEEALGTDIEIGTTFIRLALN